ncbi:hypothetical protein K2173_012360 [Erythroxylum novogranatense]|uniref:GRAM domain-containing protein n=1 Tax=Erythroxylum novogranatense TaxID=1862640 RepID=A0AAV8UAW4_9ROSI|nr:hypothetical protein K2173_012360 [Erythroxylum novogranatense]
MEPLPKSAVERKLESASQDPSHEQIPDPKTDDAPKGDANEGGSVSGSDSQLLSEQLQGVSRDGSARKSVHWSPDLVTESRSNSNGYDNSRNVYFGGSNPHVSPSPNSSSSSLSFKETMGTVKDVLGRWGKMVGEASRKAEDLVGNTWQHFLAEGGYEKIFRQTFETVSEELLQNPYACYLSTSAGPVMGVLYVSTAKLAFCSDNPLSYKSSGQNWIHSGYHEFWFMGFLNYNGAVQCLQDAMRARESQAV